MSEPVENRPPQFEQTGESRDKGEFTLTPGNIVDLNDLRYRLAQPLPVVIEKHPNAFIVEESQTKHFGGGNTQDDALINFREEIVIYREELGNTPNRELSNLLQGHKRFLVETLVPKA